MGAGRTAALERIYGDGSIAADFRRSRKSATGFLGPLLTDDLAVRKHLREIDRGSYLREEVTRRLLEFNESLGADDAALTNAGMLADPSAVVVIGGQQPGLLTGPLYTIHKAVSIVKLAQWLEQRHERPFIPMFWTASEDHDVAEIDHIFAPTAHRPNKLRAAVPQDGRSVGDIELGEYWQAFRKELTAVLDGLPHGAAVLELIDAAADGATDIAHFFSRLLTRLFAGTGLVIVQPELLRYLSRDILAQEAAERGAQTNQMIADAQGALRAAGYTPQLDRLDDALNVFLYEDRVRCRLEASDEETVRVAQVERSVPAAELAELAREEPARFSTGVALRPVVQDKLLPVAVFVGGPGELAYVAELPAVHAHFGALFPLVWPRATITLLPASVADLIDELEVPEDELFAGAEAIREGVSERGGCKASERLREVERRIAEATKEFIDIAVEMDPNLSKTGNKVLDKTMRDLAKFRDKVCQAEQRSRGLDPAKADRIADIVTPLQAPQERILNLMPLLARHGLQLINHLLDETDPLADAHQFVILDDDG